MFAAGKFCESGEIRKIFLLANTSCFTVRYLVSPHWSKNIYDHVFRTTYPVQQNISSTSLSTIKHLVCLALTVYFPRYTAFPMLNFPSNEKINKKLK